MEKIALLKLVQKQLFGFLQEIVNENVNDINF